MRDWDWYQAIYLSCLGFVLGPLLGFALFELEARFGIGVLGQLLDHHVPFAIFIGPIALIVICSLFGAVAGFVWGLLGEQIKDLIFNATAYLSRILFHRKP